MQLDLIKHIRLMVVFGFFLGVLPQMQAQQQSDKELRKARSLVRKAERAKKQDDFIQAEADYRKALSKDNKNAEASYNFGHLYGDKEMEMESMSYLLRTAKNASSKELRHKAFHNLGNAYMAQKDYAQAVRAYKDALRNDPTDDETRYNLAIAQDMLEKNPEQDQDNDQDQEQEQDDQNTRDNKESQDQQQEQEPDDEEGENEDQQDQQPSGQDDNEEEAEPEQGEQDEQDEQEGDQQDDQQDQNQDDNMSDDQAENLLRAADNLEKEVQKKLHEKKGEQIPPKPNQKDW